MNSASSARATRALAVAMVALSASGVLADEPVASKAYDFHHPNILGTSLDLTVIANSQAAAERVDKRVVDEIERFRKILSTYDPACELAILNARAPGSEPVEASIEVIEVLQQYDDWNRKTRRAYSGAIGKLIDLWQESEKADRLPSSSSLSPITTALIKAAWQINAGKSTFRKLTDQSINVDSLGKGYIVGKALAAATRDNSGVTGMLLSIGGDIRVWGKPESGATWTIGVQDPMQPALNAKPLTQIRVAGDTAVASSGGYQRFYTIGGKRYSHILDARTGRSGLNIAATVIAPDSATANALATICCILKTADAFELVRSVPNAECMIVTADGSVMRSNGFKTLEVRDNSPAAADVNLTAAWPQGYSLAIDLETIKTRHRPYVMVWITDAQDKHVRTLGAWGDETKYLREIRQWWKFARNDKKLQSMTHATQRANQYPLTWDGLDQDGKAVPTGIYQVWVEVASEDGPHAAKSVKFECGKDPTKATLTSTSAFKDVTIQYGSSAQK